MFYNIFINIIYLLSTGTPRLCWSMNDGREGRCGEAWQGLTGMYSVQDYGYRIVIKIEEELNKM